MCEYYEKAPCAWLDSACNPTDEPTCRESGTGLGPGIRSRGLAPIRIGESAHWSPSESSCPPHGGISRLCVCRTVSAAPALLRRVSASIAIYDQDEYAPRVHASSSLRVCVAASHGGREPLALAASNQLTIRCRWTTRKRPAPFTGRTSQCGEILATELAVYKQASTAACL